MTFYHSAKLSLACLGFTAVVLSSCKNTPATNTPATGTAAGSTVSTTTGPTAAVPKSTEAAPVEPIVYIDSDSLLSKYDYFKEVKTGMESKGKKLQAEMERKGRSFQAEVLAYQKNAVNLTPDQKKSTEERLGKKQQELQIYQQTLREQLGKEEQGMNQQLYDKVQIYLKEYCRANKHKMVMTYSKGGNLLYGDKSLDVTSEVVKGLNEAYSKEKTK